MDIYAAARALEAHYARIGQLPVRGTVPPQQLDDGITLKLILTPGFVERIDATAFRCGLCACHRHHCRSCSAIRG